VRGNADPGGAGRGLGGFDADFFGVGTRIDTGGTDGDGFLGERGPRRGSDL
jgi:hypothetical protein